MPDIAEVAQAPEFRSTKLALQSTLLNFERSKTPELPKVFEFGLRNVAPAVQKKITPVDRKTQEIWGIEEYPHKPLHEDVIPDRFEVLSLAEISLPSKSVMIQGKGPNIFSDISPISRYMSNMTFAEEETYLKESKKHEKNIHGYIHLLRQELAPSHLDKIDWTMASKICTGCVLKYEVSVILNPKELDNNISQILEISKEKYSHSIAEPMNTSVNTNRINSQIVQEINDADYREQELIQMMDALKYQSKTENVDDKLQMLLEMVEKKMKNNKETAANLQIRVLYQFLVEYMKAKDNLKKPQKPRSSLAKKSQAKKPQEKPKIVLTKNSSKSSVASEKHNPWIGGSKHQEDFQSESWIPSPQRKKAVKINENQRLKE